MIASDSASFGIDEVAADQTLSVTLNVNKLPAIEGLIEFEAGYSGAENTFELTSINFESSLAQNPTVHLQKGISELNWNSLCKQLMNLQHCLRLL